jgi:hypothetical protein
VKPTPLTFKANIECRRLIARALRAQDSGNEILTMQLKDQIHAFMNDPKNRVGGKLYMEEG